MNHTKTSNTYAKHFNWRVLLWLPLLLAINTFVLMLTYPIWKELKWERYPSGLWLRAYLVAALLIVVIALFVAVCVNYFTALWSRPKALLMQVGTTFAVLCITAAYIGTSAPYADANLPTTIQVLDAKFFSEFAFFWFIFADAIPISIVSSLLLGWSIRRKG